MGCSDRTLEASLCFLFGFMKGKEPKNRRLKEGFRDFYAQNPNFLLNPVIPSFKGMSYDANVKVNHRSYSNLIHHT